MIKRLLLLLTICCTLPTYAGTITGTLQTPSGLPIKNGTLGFVLQQSGLIVGTGAVVPTTAYCYTGSDGSVVGLPNPTALPAASLNLSSGTLPAGIYFVEETWVNAAGGESAVSPELRIQLTGAGSLILAVPTSVPAAATGLRIYVGAASGGETRQGVQGLTGPFILATPLISGAAPPTGNNTVCSIAFNDTIIPYQGYNVSLISSTGNAYPGWPQAWQLNGGLNGTINVSSGAPLWNGTVIYPMPILSQPLNHGPQSISGNLDFGGYNVTNVGTLTAGSVNSVVNAALQPGADISAKITSALTSCGDQCTVYVPAGSYSYANSIILPYGVFGQYKLLLDPGAVLQYTGSSDAILTKIATQPTEANLLIEGGELIGNASAISGIHLKPSQKITIRNMTILEFTGGDAILNEGANHVNIYDNTLQNNQNGLHNISTLCNSATPVVCTPSGSGGQAYSPNAVHFHDNVDTNNTHWGIFEEWNGVSGSTGALNNDYHDNVLELNGTGGIAYGAAYIMKSVGDTIGPGNYFEGSPHEVVLGQPTGGAGDFFAASGPMVIGNYFTTAPPISPLTKAYNIELNNTIDANIQGNSEQGEGGISNTTNCFINAPLGSGGAGTSTETRTLIGRNAIFQGIAEPTSGNPICSNGVGVLTLLGTGSFWIQNTNYLHQMGFQNFQVNQSVTSEVIAVANLTANGSCNIAPVAQNGTAFTNGRTTFLAGTTNLSGLIAGQVTINHPSGEAITVDIYCTWNPTGGYGMP